MTRARRALLACVLAAGAVASSAAGPAPKTHTVVIDKMLFGAAPSGVRVGDVVVWVNQDIFRHTATARDKSFDLDLKPGARAQTTIRKAGVLAYYCRFHPGMTGQMTVTP